MNYEEEEVFLATVLEYITHKNTELLCVDKVVLRESRILSLGFSTKMTPEIFYHTFIFENSGERFEIHLGDDIVFQNEVAEISIIRNVDTPNRGLLMKHLEKFYKDKEDSITIKQQNMLIEEQNMLIIQESLKRFL